MRVFLTGATGFIGSHVARRFVEEGCAVTALVRVGSSLRRIADIVGKIKLLEGDLSAARMLEAPLKADLPDVCLHLAWYAEPGNYLNAVENLDHVRWSLDLLRVLSSVGCPHVIIAGTCFEHDTEMGYLAESSPKRPQSLYAASKYALHLIAERFQRLQHQRLSWGHIFFQHGPWEDERRLVPYIIQRLLSGESCLLSHGNQIRDYLHVDDVANAFWLIAKTGSEGSFNIGSGRPVTVAQVAEGIGELLQRRELLKFGARPAPDGDPNFVCANIHRLKSITGWSPRYSLRTGLEQTVYWWLQRTDLVRPGEAIAPRVPRN